jgi:hypothetical protein
VSLLNFSGDSDHRQGEKKTLRLLFGIGALVGVIALGSTLAASINLNSGGPVEFGQGVTQTTSCDSEILVTPYSSFVNGDPGEFMFTSLRLEGVDTTSGSGSNEGCAGKTFAIKLYEEEGYQFPQSYEISVDSDGVFSSPSGDTDGTLEGNENSSVTLTFDESLIDAELVYRITIESSSTQAVPSSYEVGDVGPGGGKIFYVDANGFNCGPLFNETGSPTQGKCNYLEAAPNTWNGGTNDPAVDFCNVYSEIMTIDDLGAGLRNSIAMLSACSYTAANMVETYNLSNGGGKSDWFLGSRNEMAQLHAAKDVVGGWQVGDDVAYWMSANHNDDRALVFRIFPGSEFDGLIEDKFAPRYVRPIRAF